LLDRLGRPQEAATLFYAALPLLLRLPPAPAPPSTDAVERQRCVPSGDSGVRDQVKDVWDQVKDVRDQDSGVRDEEVWDQEEWHQDEWHGDVIRDFYLEGGGVEKRVEHRGYTCAYFRSASFFALLHAQVPLS